VLALDPRTVDAVWTALQGHLPARPPDTHPLGCHRPRIPDRDCFTGILVRLVTGCSWDVAARLTPAGETTLRGRRTEWLKAGVFDKLLTEALAAYDRIIGLDLGEVAVDGSLHKAPCGGQGTGPNPTDRGKIGWKWSIATDTVGVPIGWVIDGANRNDSVLLEPTLQAVAARGLLADVQTLHLDKGYDSHLTIERCHTLGVRDVVCAKKQPKVTAKHQSRTPRKRRTKPTTTDPTPSPIVTPIPNPAADTSPNPSNDEPTKATKKKSKSKKAHTLGLRWPVERTNSWLSNFGQMRRNTDRYIAQRLGQIALAVTLILTVKLIKWAKRWND
jgi:transposase